MQRVIQVWADRNLQVCRFPEAICLDVIKTHLEDSQMTDAISVGRKQSRPIRKTEN